MRGTGLRARDELELKIERTLEAAPLVVVPEDFAARVAAQARSMRRPLPENASVRTSEVGRRVMWAVAALLLVAILVLAPGAGLDPGAAHATRFWVAFALELEFAALTLWMSLRGLRA